LFALRGLIALKGLTLAFQRADNFVAVEQKSLHENWVDASDGAV
jgi:hypothetical protein